MSTNATQTNAPARATQTEQTTRLTLAALTRALDAFQRAPTQRELNALLRRLELGPEELSPHLGFKPHTYTRHRVFRSHLCEMLVLCWMPGQRTAIHDHNGSYGAIRICEGSMKEEIFALNEAGEVAATETYLRAGGEVTGTDVPDIHRIGCAEDGAERMITIHVYAPPLRVINTYQLGSAEVGKCWPDDPANPANS
ncbi:MAG TPA: cysteine dioxygenase family protein [Pyrinomonadaceae bacterium]|nr:cysteine dioxygenase family protein [Pyrinomonadaceae bacterium]